MVTARFAKGTLSGQLVKENYHTVWMQLGDGKVIKRHRRKHHVRVRDER